MVRVECVARKAMGRVECVDRKIVRCRLDRREIADRAGMSPGHRLGRGQSGTSRHAGPKPMDPMVRKIAPCRRVINRWKHGAMLMLFTFSSCS